MTKLFTLVIVHGDSEILLGLKKRGFATGCLNGFGGKVLEGEDIEMAARRELLEEAGIEALDLEKRGVLRFSFEDSDKVFEVHVYRTSHFKGVPEESEEMKPAWFPLSAIPYERMWPDDEYWLPLLLSGKKFKGKFHFDRPSGPEYRAKVLQNDLVSVEDLS